MSTFSPAPLGLHTLLGLLTGLTLYWAGFARPGGLKRALALRRCIPLRSGLSALGYGIAGAALLIWLAVLDVDALITLPVNWRVLVGGGLFGLSIALSGFTPTTAFAGLGTGSIEALCTLIGCALGTLFLPEGTALPGQPASLLMLGCTGGLLTLIALCIPNPKA